MRTKLLVIMAVLIGSFCGIRASNACTPPPVAILTVEPNDTVVGVPVVFDGNSSYAIGGKTIVKYEWDFDGNGTYDCNEVPPCDGNTTHAYTIAGDYTAKLRVTDNRGLTAVDTSMVHIGLKVWYVDADATGDNDGSSWANAFTDLQNALNEAEQVGSSDQEVWVAEGTYKPSKKTDANDARTATFKIVDHVDIYGGFGGTETILSQRNWNTYVTTLSGDIGVTDVNTDNCYHVVTGPNDVNTAIDGFTVTKGCADISGEHRQRGGGIYCCSYYGPTIRNCTIKGNYASQDGGGIYIQTHPAYSPKIISCNIIDNDSELLGGGIYVAGSSPEIRDCNISNNRALFYGGGEGAGIYWFGYDVNGLIENCIFVNNESDYGGGALDFGVSQVDKHCRVTIRNSIFSGNTAGSLGGAVHNHAQFNSPDDLTFTNCVFVANRCGTKGGAIHNYGTSPTITNCTFTDNDVNSIPWGPPGYGGAIYNRYVSSYGGSSSSPPIRNCIFWDNYAKTAGNEIYNETDCDPNISYSDVKECGGSGSGWDPNVGADGGGNIDLDPNFVDFFNPTGYDGLWMTYDDGLAIDNTRCIDAGNGNLAPAKDIIGSSRYDDPNWTNIGAGDPNYIDMGAYEYNPYCRI
jgi:hypothetical protein